MRIRGRSTERGAVAVLTAVVVGAVLLAVLALSVDVGGMTLERRQLQNAADATAMALAQDCAEKNIDECAPALLADVEPLLNDNSWLDDQGAFDTGTYPLGVCARNVPAFSDICASATGAEPISDLAKCPPLPDWLQGAGSVLPYVETYSRTLSDGGSTLLPVFGPDAAGTTQAACSRAAWGPGAPSSANVIALTMSECDWADQTGYTGPGTATYPPPPGPNGYGTPSNPWPVGFETTVFSKGNDTTCETSAPGGTAPGGFAWLDSISASECLGTVVNNNWVHGDTGNDGCEQADLNKYLGTIVHLPVFDCRSDALGPHPIPPGFDCSAGSGNNTYYHITGYAAFFLTGWSLTKGTQPSIASGTSTCGGTGGEGGNRCLFGWFLKDLVPEGDIVPPGPSDPDYGLVIVKPAG